MCFSLKQVVLHGMMKEKWNFSVVQKEETE